MLHVRGRCGARGMAGTHKEGSAVDDGGFSLVPRVPTPSGGARACRGAMVAETGQIAYDQSGMPGRASCASLAASRPHGDRGSGAYV
jgi:hypothetical protein